MTIAPERVVAVPGGLVGIEPAARPPRTHGSAGRAPALVVRRRPDDPDGDVLLRRPYGVAGLGYDPADNRLATMGHDGSACVWQLDGHRPLLAHHAFWAGPARPDDTAHLDDTANPIGAVAARGGRIAWAAADGTVRLGPPGRPPARPGCPVGRLAFLPDQRLLAAGGDRVVLIDPVTARIADTVQLAGLAEQPTCVLAGEDWLVFTADDKDLRCHDCSHGRFETLWERDTFAVPALAVIRLEERPVLVVYDATDRVYRALDARSGVQLALKDADRAAAPAELLADGRTGTVYARHTSDRGRFSVLEFAGEQP